MQRILYMVGAVLLIAVLAFGGYRFYTHPMTGRMQTLNERLKGIKAIDVKFEKPPWDFDKWQRAVAAKPALWEALVAAPLPPPPPPKPQPNLVEMVKDISFGRQQIGSKIKMVSGKESKGTFVSIGDTVNGLTVKSIDKTSVVLSMQWEGQELTTELPRK